MPGTCSVDTSPLVYLFRTSKLDLVRALFREVLVAEEVGEELAAGLAAGAHVPDLADYPWIRRCGTSDLDVPARLVGLGSGELGTILLGTSGRAEWAILDDLGARHAAEAVGVEVVGTVGILALAKKRGLISTIAPVLQELTAAGMWLSQSLIDDVLELAGER